MSTQQTLADEFERYAAIVNRATGGWDPFAMRIDRMLEEAEAFYVALAHPDRARTPDEERAMRHLLDEIMYGDHGLIEHVDPDSEAAWTWYDRHGEYDRTRAEQLDEAASFRGYLREWEGAEHDAPDGIAHRLDHFLAYSEAAATGWAERTAEGCGMESGTSFHPLPWAALQEARP